MNDNLQPLPDEHLEARITAWVLGQASPFEAAELEALCAADPELQLFLNRTKALHSLLLETPPSSSDQFWKLSPENREKLDPIIGSNHSAPSNNPSGIRRAAYRAAFGIAAVLTVTLFIKRFVFAPLSSDKEASTMVAYESMLNSQASDEEVFFEKSASDSPSKSIATSSPRKPSAPSSSAPAPTSERDNSIAMADSKFKNDSKGRSREDYNKPAGMARNVPQEEQKALADNGVVNDGGIGYGSKDTETDMSNTYPAIEALALTNKANASNTPAAPPATIPVPTGELAKSSANYGDGKDFGKGWGSAEGKANDALAANDNQDKGGFRYEPGASKKESVSSQGALSAEGLAAMKEKRVDANSSITQEPGSNFTGSFKSAENGAIAGNRSGDDAVDRKSIDGILSNPDRSFAAEQGASRGPTAQEAPVGRIVFNDTEPSRSNPALAPEHVEKVDDIRRDLYKAQGNYDLGKYDDAKKSYEDILRVDPHNEAARRGMEKVAGAKSEYYRAAYGHTRANLLMEVDKAWELAVPAEGEMNEDPFANNKPTDDSLAAWDGITISGATFGSRVNSKTEGENNTPADFVGYINYGSPIQGEAKQVDITTKFTEVTQANNQELGFDWVFDPLAKADADKSNIPVTPATPAVFPEISEDKVALLEELPHIGRLFKDKPSLIDLSEELSAAEEAFSTFSLNISDASFQLALAAIEKGERPDPTSIKPEQFYNAVDYGDPAPSASEPVAAEIDQTAHPVIPGRNLVRVALRTGSTGRSAAQPLRLTLLVDQSGSMVRADRRVAMETALAQLATLLTEQDQVTVIGFSRTPHLLAQSLPGNQAAKLPEIINQTASEGGTNLEQAINLATEQALGNHLAGAQNRIVLFTDGAANLGDADPDRLSEKIKNIRQQGLAFDIAGIGTNDVNDKLLSDLARHGNGRYYLVGEKTAGNLAAQLAGAFRPAAENVKVQVKLNPQRVGNYKLIGFEKDRLKTEDFRNDAVDAAELAADEAGVALYQVETLTEGTGEIGEVSVRFRDTASGEMVERTWTIPYDASAPSFDKANPKTQLATLALLAAQKLQTGPMADAIDFSNYSETIAKLKQANAKSAKTQQLLNLINAIK